VIANMFHQYQQNNHLSPKDSINIDCQQFHQCQQNEQIPISLTVWTQKRWNNDTIHWKSRSWLGTATLVFVW